MLTCTDVPNNVMFVDMNFRAEIIIETAKTQLQLLNSKICSVPIIYREQQQQHR